MRDPGRRAAGVVGLKAPARKTVAVCTLGCKVNQWESQSIVDALRRKGWQSVDFDGSASVYVVNTCTVTLTADQKSRKIIRGAKKRNPGALLIVTGCYAEREREALLGIAEIDLILGNGQKEKLPDIVEEAWEERAKRGFAAPDASRLSPQEDAAQEKPDGFLKGLDRTRATLKIQDGCRRYCSYCVIPYARKENASMPLDEIVSRAGGLAAAGYREIVLLGIHLGDYGLETGGGEGLAEVFGKLLESFPRVRFRLGSLEPMEASDDLVALIREYPNACKHLHLPLQSGSDRILQAMKRPYRTADYREKARAIREAIPAIALTTDVMAGFPGEGEDEFRQSLAFIEEMAFSRIHVFTYSRRPGTPAAEMPDQIPKAIRERRSEEFLRLGSVLRDNYGDSLIGRRQQVLLEEEIGGGAWGGHSDNYLEVTFLPGRGAGEDQGEYKGKVLPLTIVGRSPLKPGAWQGVPEENERNE